jgi:hypothetical protein
MTHGLLAFSVCPPHCSNRYVKNRLIFPAPFIDVLASLFLDEYDASSGDLNLIVPHEKFFTMYVFLRKLTGYVTAERQMEAHSSVTASVARFIRYRKLHLVISLTQAGVIARREWSLAVLLLRT